MADDRLTFKCISEHAGVQNMLAAQGLKLDICFDCHRKTIEEDFEHEVFRLQENMEGLSLVDTVYTVLKTRQERVPIRLVPFEKYKTYASMPRLGLADNDNPVNPVNPAYGEVQFTDITVNANEIDRENSFLVYISHTWLGAWDGVLPDGTVNERASVNWYVFKYGECCTHETDTAILSRSRGGYSLIFVLSHCVLLSALVSHTPSHPHPFLPSILVMIATPGEDTHTQTI